MQLEDTTVEVILTLQHLGPTLELTLDEKYRKDPNWFAKGDPRFETSKLIEDVINRFAANQRRLGKLRLLKDLPLALREILGIDVSFYADLIKSWEGPNITNLPRLTIKDVRKTSVSSTVMAEWETKVTKEMIKIKERLEPRIKKLEPILTEIRRSAGLSYLDCPTGPADGSPRLRFVFKWPENADAQNYPAAELVLVFPNSEKSEFLVRDATDLDSRKIKQTGVSLRSDEFPLGIRIGQVAVQENGLPRIVASPLNTISVYDPTALANSLRRLGLPRELELLSLDIRPNELQQERSGSSIVLVSF